MPVPFVLMHGFLGGSAQWQAQVAALSARRPVITPDLPGFGAAADTTALSNIGDCADWVLDKLERDGVERFDLLGHSMGGMIVQEMARRAPARVARLVLYSTGSLGVMPGRFETIEESRQRVLREGTARTAERIASAWFVAGKAAAGFPLCRELGERASSASMLAALTAMEQWDGRDRLGQVQAPTLVLWGDCDQSYPWSQTESLWRGIPGARLAVIPGCGHCVHLEKPVLFNAHVDDFLGAST